MSTKKNEICTVGVRQIKKSKDLAIGAAQKDIAKYVKIVSAYGNVVPATVASDGDIYRLIDGHARLEAYMRAGVGNIPAVVVQSNDEAGKIKLSLLLSASRERGSPLSEGAMIEKLIKEHGQTLKMLSDTVGRSKAWLSKRQTMARNLSASIANMVLNGDICTRAAEEIAKLPRDEQSTFAANVVKDGLNKNDVCELVRMYRSPDANFDLCRAIIEDPSNVLLAANKRGARTHKGRAKKSAEGRLGGAAYLAMNLLDVVTDMLMGFDTVTINTLQSQLLLLRKKMLVLAQLITAQLNFDVSPGKREGDFND